jgi:Cu-Zn family superoxide dismutase
MKAVAVFKGTGGVTGETTFEDSANGLVIRAKFTELPSQAESRGGDHGFHIHSNGDLRGEGCLGACLHYNKGPKRNHGGAPGFAGERHTGDLGNISRIDHTYIYKLPGVSSSELLGRTLIVHADPDDLGKGGEEDSLITGHAGKRIACAIIGRAVGCDAKKTRKVRR